jgi:hypothetical protein
MLLYGNDWKKVQRHIGTRSPTQARSHAQKFFIRIKKKIFKDRPNEEPLNAGAIVNQIKTFVKDEILDKVIRNADDKRFAVISENKEKLSKVLLLMMSNFTKEKSSKGKILDLDNLNNFDYSFKEEDFLIWEKQSGNSNACRKNKKNEIFSIEKTSSRKISQEETPTNNIPIFNNQLFSPTGNSYINIVTINVCKNEKDNIPFMDENLDMLDFNNKNANFINFINDQKNYKSVNNSMLKPKKEDFSSFKSKQLSSYQPFNADLIFDRNNLISKFDDAQDDFYNNAFINQNENHDNKEKIDFDFFN